MLPSLDAPMSHPPQFSIDLGIGRRKHAQLAAVFKAEEIEHARWAAAVNRELAAWNAALRDLTRVEPLLGEVG